MTTMEDRRLTPFVADTIIAVGLFAMSVVTMVDWSNWGFASIYSREADWFAVVLVVGQTVPLMFRRRWPIPVMGIVLASFMLDRGLDYPNTIATVGTLVAIHALGSELPPKRSMAIGVSVTAIGASFTLLGAFVYDSVGFEDAIFIVLTAMVALYLGREVRYRSEHTRLLTQQAASAELEREQRAAEAVAEERARIARELHDVVAHQMVVMTVNAEGAARLAKDADHRVQDALETIKEAGHEGLAEMRRMVGLLREEGSAGDLAPQPSLARLGDLAEHFDSAGLPVEVTVEGELDHLTSLTDLNAYRIVQESLTNSLKHGGPDTSAQVTVELDSAELRIRVTDDGRGATAPSNGGHGLVGMRERVAILGGEFAAGPHAGGGYEVSATLPVAT